MKMRAGKLMIWALVTLVTVVLVPVAWVAYRFLYPGSGSPPSVNVPSRRNFSFSSNSADHRGYRLKVVEVMGY